MILETAALCVSCGDEWTVPYATQGETVEMPVHECANAPRRRGHLSVVR